MTFSLRTFPSALNANTHHVTEAAPVVVVAPLIIRPNLQLSNHVIGAQRSVLLQHFFFLNNLASKEILP